MANIEILNYIIITIGAVFFYHKAIDAIRLKAQYKLYAVRDELIYLVASGSLREEDAVFNFYYKRINALLAQTPNVGLDDLLQYIFNYKNNNNDFEKQILKAKKDADEILDNPSMKKEEVRIAIAQYYLALNDLILAHSSITRMVYLIGRHLNGVFINKIGEKLLSLLGKKGSYRAYKAARFAECEANEISGGQVHACA